MSVIRWEDPPPSIRGGTVPDVPDYTNAVRQLRSRPGRWGVLVDTPITSNAGTLVTRIRRGERGFDPPGAFEAVMRTVVKGARYCVYARYVGEGGAS